MGGAGALQLAFNHPDLFHTVGAHSPSLHLDDGTFPLLGTGADFDAREPLRLALLAPNIDALTIWIDAGGDDPWLPRDTQLHQSLIDRGIAHTWTVLPGGHDGPYWKRNIERYLRFYAGAFTAADSHS
jgi:enterochelin esterase-like enzyme